MNNNIFFKSKFYGWNIGESLKTLCSNLDKDYKNVQLIDLALEEGGINIKGHPSKPLEYHTKDFLDYINFELVYTLNTDEEINKYRPLPGDIAVMYSPVGKNGNMCMYTGYEWISDRIQDSIYPYKTSGNNPRTIWIHRWNGNKWFRKNNFEIS